MTDQKKPQTPTEKMTESYEALTSILKKLHSEVQAPGVPPGQIDPMQQALEDLGGAVTNQNERLGRIEGAIEDLIKAFNSLVQAAHD